MVVIWAMFAIGLWWLGRTPCSAQITLATPIPRVIIAHMKISLLLFLSTLSLFSVGCGANEHVPNHASEATVTAAPINDWPGWRGPDANGHAGAQSIVTEWDSVKNWAWKKELPGRGHASPVVVGDRVYIHTAEAGKYQALIAYDRVSGVQKWRTDLHTTGVEGKLHDRNSFATSTPVWNGEALFVPCYNGGKIVLSRVEADGTLTWQKPLMDFKSLWGYSVSPALHGDLVLLAVEHLAAGAMFGIRQSDGEIVWKTPRPETPNHATPVILKLNGRDELVIPGAHQLASFNPQTGEVFWSTKATTLECVGSAVQVGNLVFGAGGYPDAMTSCVDASKPQAEKWHAKKKVYQPSLLAVGDYLYGVTDKGIAYCWKASNGKEQWAERLKNPVAASPVLVNDLILIAGERGVTTIFKANPKKIELVAENKLGNDNFASPAVCGSQIFLRVAFREKGKRTEVLYCIGE